MPYFGDGAPYYYGGSSSSSSFSNHSSLMTSVGRYYSPIAARYAPHLSTISETPSYVVHRRRHGATSTSSAASTSSTFTRPRRIIDTADIDVSKPPRSYSSENRSQQQQQQQRHRLRRDRPTIKIRSQALKDNPALREYNEKHEKTKGELLVEKFLIKDKQQQQQQSSGERKMRLYHQASLLRPSESAALKNEDEEEDEDLLTAMRRRVTRRMTRRRSSADVIPLNPEQIEREAALLAAQAEALDNLVAEEQAEIEVEVRRGIFAKRQAMRLPIEISELSETEDDEPDGRSSRRHSTAKKKKRKKSDGKLALESEEEDDDDEVVLEIPESVIEEEEEEEFEWDDRKKCDDVNDLVPRKGEVILKINDVVAAKSRERLDSTAGRLNKREEEPKVNGVASSEPVAVLNDASNAKSKSKINLDIIDAKIQETRKEIKDLILKEKRFPELKRREKMLKLDEAKATEEKKKATDKSCANKIEPKAAKLTTEKEKHRVPDKNEVSETKTVEERANREKKTTKSRDKSESAKPNEVEAKSTTNDASISQNEHPNRSESPESDLVPRFKIEACNSVGDFSTLYVKAANAEISGRTAVEQYRESVRLPAPPKASAVRDTEAEVVLPVRRPYVLDSARNSVYLALKPSQRNASADSSVIEEASASRPAKCQPVTPAEERRSKIESPDDAALINEKRRSRAVSEAEPTSRTEPSSETVQIPELLSGKSVQAKPKSSTKGGKEEFVAWWDETEEEVVQAEDKTDKSEKLKDKESTAVKVEAEKKVVDKATKTKKKETVEEKSKNKVQAPLESESSKKTEVQGVELRDKSKAEVEVADKKIQNTSVEDKEKSLAKVIDKKEKTVSEKEIKLEEKTKSAESQKKSEPLPKSSEEKKKETTSQEVKSVIVDNTEKIVDKKVETKVKTKESTKVEVTEPKEKPVDKILEKKDKSVVKKVELKDKETDSTKSEVKETKEKPVDKVVGKKEKLPAKKVEVKEKEIDNTKSEVKETKEKPVDKVVEKKEKSPAKKVEVKDKETDSTKSEVKETKEKPLDKVLEKKDKLAAKKVEVKDKETDSTKSEVKETKEKPVDKILEKKDKSALKKLDVKEKITESIKTEAIEPKEKPVDKILEKKEISIAKKVEVKDKEIDSTKSEVKETKEKPVDKILEKKDKSIAKKVEVKDKETDSTKSEVKETKEKLIDKAQKKSELPTKLSDEKKKDTLITPTKETPSQEVKTEKKEKTTDKKIEAKDKVKETTKTEIIEPKEKPIDKLLDKKDKVTKTPSDKETKSTEKSKSSETPKKSKEKSTSPSSAPSKNKSLSSPSDKKPRPESPRYDHHALPNIPEEPQVTSPPPTEQPEPLANLSKVKTSESKSEPRSDKSLLAKETSCEFPVAVKKAEQPIGPNLARPAQPPVGKREKDDRKKKVDAAAVMKIEKKILEDSESPHKIRSSAIPETQIIEAAQKQQQQLIMQSQTAATPEKVGPTEIDFWSEIGTPESAKAPEPAKSLHLDLSKVSKADDAEEPRTPLAPNQEDQSTPLIAQPASPRPDNLNQVPLINLQLSESLSSVAEPTSRKDSEELLLDRSGTVKKISKWSNHDNLSKLNEADGDATPLASKEASPQTSIASSTAKKKVVKKKKSVATGKKKSEKTGTEGSKPATKKKKNSGTTTAASPQTSQLRTPMSAAGSPRNSPSQRPADLNKLFYTTPAILLTATPRDLRKVRRAKVKRKKPATRTPSLSSDSTGSTRSTATTSTEEGSNCEEDAEQKRLASTRSNDSGFDGSPRLSNCDMVCHKKCEKLTGNLCGLNQKLVAEALQALKKAPSQSSDNQRNADGDHFHHSGRITPPATNLPRFKKYEVTDFNFLKVLGKGSFGKVLLSELRGTDCVYAVKCLKKDVVLEDDDVECTLIERKVLTLATRHPYLCHLFCTFQTESHLFFVMEYLNGGDLMFHIQKSGRFSEARAKFYAAEIWSGLIFLHKKGIVYRDLKLDNVLLDFEGHIRIADFGMCKLQIFLDRTADTFCGTPDYMAPEIIKGLKYNQAVDWWSYGVLLYEMLTGQSPFSGCDEDELFWSICNERPFIPRYLSQSATELLVCLLEKDSGKRIPGHEIACHPFFCTIAWDKLERRSLEPPFKPAVEHTLDTRYFDTAFTTERPRLTPVPEQILTSMDQSVFRGFSYTNPNATD